MRFLSSLDRLISVSQPTTLLKRLGVRQYNLFLSIAELMFDCNHHAEPSSLILPYEPLS